MLIDHINLTGLNRGFFSLKYKACLLRGLANSSDTRRVTRDEAKRKMRRRKKTNIQFCIRPLTIDSHLHQPLDNGCKKKPLPPTLQEWMGMSSFL